MIVPKYWSESKIKTTVNKRQFTIKRFGWSDDSEAEAKKHADKRLDEALKTLRETGNVRRIDHKVSYNGAEGIPIREEVVSTHQDVIISRNSYGALCLNTPDIMFADIDLNHAPSTRLTAIVFLLLAIVSAIAGLAFKSWGILVGSMVLSLIMLASIAQFIHDVIANRKGGAENRALEHIKRISSENPELHLRVYRTPMGFRVLFMEDTHDPASEKTIQLLNNLKSDPVYIQMCRNQSCFRARVSPKPWRIGVDRIRPRPGVWPIKPEHTKERQLWIREYEQKSRAYASCHFLMSLGTSHTHPKAKYVKELHDKLCNVQATNRQLA